MEAGVASYFPVTPPSFIFDVAGQAMQTAIEAQKNAVDLVVEQTQSASNVNKVRAEAYSKIAAEVTNDDPEVPLGARWKPRRRYLSSCQRAEQDHV